MPLNAFIFIGPEGHSPLEEWVLGARLAATADLLSQLKACPEVTNIIIATPLRELSTLFADWPVTWDFDTESQPFHFGERLAQLTAAYPAPAVAYFGAGCAPLLAQTQIQATLGAVLAAASPFSITNNLLSSDWLVSNCVAEIQTRTERLGRDNMLAPVLKYEANLEVHALPASAATRADIDTPADLLALSQHPYLPSNLHAYLELHPVPEKMTANWRAARRLLATPGSRITLIGRVSAAVLSALEARTRCWTRVFSEERGMTASGRQAQGNVHSLVARHLARVGPAAFFAEMAEMTDLVIFDTRVVLASTNRWPSAADRYASDAGQPELIADSFLRELTQAALNAPVPVLLGGHGVVTGDLYALLETDLKRTQTDTNG